MSDVNAPVLVLNTGWTPIHIKNVKDAVSDVFSEIAEVVEHSDFNIQEGDIASSAWTTNNWEKWTEVSSVGLPFLRTKIDDLRREAEMLRGEAKVLVDQEMAAELLREANELDKKARGNTPRVLKLARGLEVRGPEVIRLNDYNDIPDLEIRLTRRNLLLRDNFSCQYCGKKVTSSTFTIDHVMPKSRGGDGSWENFVVACFACNVAKRDRTPQEANLILRSKPGKPKWYPLATRFAFKTPLSWEKFLPQSALNNRPSITDVDEKEADKLSNMRRR